MITLKQLIANAKLTIIEENDIVLHENGVLKLIEAILLQDRQELLRGRSSELKWELITPILREREKLINGYLVTYRRYLLPNEKEKEKIIESIKTLEERLNDKKYSPTMEDTLITNHTRRQIHELIRDSTDYEPDFKQYITSSTRRGDYTLESLEYLIEEVRHCL